MKKIFSVLLLLLVSGSAHAQTFDCKGGIASNGDTKADVIAKCGEPAGRDSRQEELVEKIDADTKRKTIITIDEWTYNPGPDRLMRVITFRNGRLTDIRETGYGTAGSSGKTDSCADHSPDRGATRAEVRELCGEPFSRDERKEEIVDAVDADTRKKTIVTIEEWTYNYGPSKFLRIFSFTNGKLTDVSTGGYGY